MQLAHDPIHCLDTSHGSGLENRVHLTQKEVHYVQQTTESVAEFQLRRIRSDGFNNRGDGIAAAPVVPSLEPLRKLDLLPIHESLALHAISLQLEAFSGGALTHETSLRPLWLSLVLDGKGLRRMTPDTFEYASRLVGLVGIEGLEPISRRYVTDPWQAYRLGHFSLALERLDLNPAHEGELRLRISLATGAFDGNGLAEAQVFARGNSRLRASLLSSAVAYTAKQGKAAPIELVAELEAWISTARERGVSSDDTFLFAQVMNAINLVYLTQGKVGPISEQMTYLLERVTPQIADPSRRAHVEGNAHFQRSILARKRGDRSAEVDALLTAMDLDRGFATLYYRMAQIFHDQCDARAEPFYEMALALSPFDLPTANDYGCFLADSGSPEKFESWATLCRVLYPEQFAAEGGSS